MPDQWPAPTKWTEPELALIASYVSRRNIKSLSKARGDFDMYQHVHDPKGDRRYIYRVDPSQGVVKSIVEVVRGKNGQPPIFRPVNPPAPEKQATLHRGDAAKEMLGGRMNPSDVDMKNIAQGQKTKFQLEHIDKSFVPGSRDFQQAQFDREHLGKWNYETALEGGVGGARRQKAVLTKKTQEQQIA